MIADYFFIKGGVAAPELESRPKIGNREKVMELFVFENDQTHKKTPLFESRRISGSIKAGIILDRA
jgi:hypothetical protein